MRESKFWDYIRKGMAGLWWVERIENAAGSGTPDVDFSVAPRIHGKMELKYLPEAPKRRTTPVRIDHFTAEQKLYFRTRGRMAGDVWLFVQMESTYFLFTWEQALICETWTREEWIENAKAHWNQRINWHELKVILKDGC